MHIYAYLDKGRFMKKIILIFIALFIAVCGCHREPSIEDHPVKKIEISKPGEFIKPEQKGDKKDLLLGADKIYKVDARRYYNTVIPMGAVEISVKTSETRFYVPDMKSPEVWAFLNKYFPYQAKKRLDNRFIVEGKLMEQYADDSIVPQFDPNIIKPTADSVIDITVFWNQNKKYFEWKYTDPMERVRGAEADRAAQAKAEENNLNLNPVQNVAPSNDSPGLMVNSEPSEIR